MDATQLNKVLDQYHLLQHPFYQAWTAGELSLEELGIYAQQYYHQEANLPRCLSAIHSQCADQSSRKVLLGNLMDEEAGEENHAELWMQFAESLHVSRDSVREAELHIRTKALVEGFRVLCSRSYEAGLGALYAYERQVPEVAQSKIDGLKKFYGINSESGLKFFAVHMTADEWHAQEVLGLIEKLTPAQRTIAEDAAIEAAKLLWGFLDGMQEIRGVTDMQCAMMN